jgi:hypothetical protein
MQRKTADAIARGEEPPCDGLYAPIDKHHYFQRKTVYAVARGEKPRYGGLYAPGGLYGPSVNPCVANPPTKKAMLTVKFCQPSHEFTFGVGMTFVSYPLVLTPVV